MSLNYRNRYNNRNNNSVVKRARNNIKAATNQNDCTTVNININHIAYAGCSIAWEKDTVDGVKLPWNQKQCGTIAINIYELLYSNMFFENYSTMFDQFKIDSVKVKVTPSQWSVFNQDRSVINYIDNTGIKKGPIYSTVRVNPVNSDFYILNPNYEPTNRESSINPRYVVPGVSPEIGNYVAIPSQGEEWSSYRNKDIKFVVNWFGNPTFNPCTFIDGKVKFNTFLQSQITSIAETPDDYFNDTYIYPQALTVITAWDRSGLSNNQFEEITDGYYINDSNGTCEDLNDRDNKYFVFNIGDNISTYSSAQSHELVGKSKFNVNRYIYPSSVQEKGTYYSTNSLNKQFKRNTLLSSHYIYEVNGNDTILSNDNLTNYYESTSIPFKPTFLIGVLGNKEVRAGRYNEGTPEVPNYKGTASGMIKPIKFSLEFDVVVTFRGLRKYIM